MPRTVSAGRRRARGTPARSVWTWWRSARRRIRRMAWTRESVLRIWTLVMGVVVMACSGTLYAYSVYASDFCARLGYSATDSSIIVGLGDAGLYLSGVASGWLVDVHGVRITALISAVLMTGGYLGMAYTYSGAIENTNVALVGFYFSMVGVGSSGAYIAALWPNVRNFSSNHRGLVVGLLVSLVGLSALIFSQIHLAFFVTSDEDQYTFGMLVFMAVTLGVVTTISAFTMVVVKPAQLPVDASKDGDADRAPLLLNESDAATPAPETSPATQPKIRRYSAVRIFKTRDFWLMFVALMFASGAGLMYINSVGRIVEALSGPDDDVSSQLSLQVSLISAMSCTGRLGFGLVSDMALRRWRVRRRNFMPIAVGMMLVAMGALALTTRLEALTGATLLIGLSYGGLFSATPTIVSERYGVSGFGVNWGWLCWATAFGGQAMSSLFGAVWDSYVPVGEDCLLGTTCYLLAVYVNIGTVALGFVVALYFAWRRKPTDDAEYVRLQQELEDSELLGSS